ncbi:MAG: DUF367 family protein [Nitrososphaerales archaeon]
MKIQLINISIGRNFMKVYVCLLKQDDPKKCTARKLAQKGHAIAIHSMKRLPRSSIVLHPFASRILSRTDAGTRSLGVIDCSWVNAQATFNGKIKGLPRRLPLLLAGNPTNYAKIGKLSSAEALAAALDIMGNKIFAQKVMSIFKWGTTFLDLNSEPLREYSRATSQDEIKSLEQDFFPNLIEDYYKAR